MAWLNQDWIEGLYTAAPTLDHLPRNGLSITSSSFSCLSPQIPGAWLYLWWIDFKEKFYGILCGNLNWMGETICFCPRSKDETWPIFIVSETVVVEPVIRNLLEYQDLQRHICLNRAWWDRDTDLDKRKVAGGGEEYLKMKFKSKWESTPMSPNGFWRCQNSEDKDGPYKGWVIVHVWVRETPSDFLNEVTTHSSSEGGGKVGRGWWEEGV